MSELADIVVGDRLIVDSFGRHGTYTVKRLTPTQAVCEQDVRFNLDSGRRVGEATSRGCGASYARKMTPDDYLHERIKLVEYALQRLRVNKDNLAAVEALLIEAKARGSQ